MDAPLPPKRAEDSVTVKHEIVLPSDSNALGSAFGGCVMGWIDIGAAITAQRHCRRKVVTASMDELHFHAPIRVGMTAVIAARVTATFRHSLEVSVVVEAEDPLTGDRNHCCSALLTFTALDDDFRPTPVPPLLLETEEDRERQERAEARRAVRLKNRKQT